MKQSKLRSLLVPVLSVLLGFLVGAIIMLIFNYNPVAGYSAMIKASLGKPFYIGETLRQATPLILVGLGFAVANNAGFFNIGVAGQALVGWLTSVWCAMLIPDVPKIICLPVCILAGMLGGAIWAGIAGFLKAYFNTSEVIVTIMLNYTALSVTNYIVRNILTDKSDATPKISENASLRADWITNLTQHSTLHAGIFIAIAAVFIVWFVMNKTTLGFELKTVGLNKFAAEYAGMSAKKNIILSMMISGCLAGLGGAMEGLGTFQNIFTFGALPDIGFDGLAVALLGSSNPFGIVFASLIFGVLRIGGNSMPINAGVPKEVVSIVMASIIFFVGTDYLIRLALDKISASKKVKVD
ncbi:nucleoside ABC transporter membrane protein [Granulicatella balaenopterae]|uniref:Nucleoside ABC transporter membrane protein n=1 Tax=Granulicatella balaenopterae TaxID=137733 RepID=A0A1H9K887_9LACT|nr:ABC transporter permease [Granulicatella balaenopterae]SEQ95133.1 nucleoside ABC transporter membrane protein [Granulicatella balaenopterae]